MEGSYQKFYECIILNKLLKKPWSMIFFFVCFKEGTEVFTKMRLNDWINWLDRRIRVNFNKLNWHLCSISKKHSLYQVLCYLTSRGNNNEKIICIDDVLKECSILIRIILMRNALWKCKPDYDNVALSDKKW